MAHTKQTPRNPNVERPTAAMGSDIQPERRIPSNQPLRICTQKEENSPENICYINS